MPQVIAALGKPQKPLTIARRKPRDLSFLYTALVLLALGIAGTAASVYLGIDPSDGGFVMDRLP
jgi:hypothetical protein